MISLVLTSIICFVIGVITATVYIKYTMRKEFTRDYRELLEYHSGGSYDSDEEEEE